MHILKDISGRNFKLRVLLADPYVYLENHIEMYIKGGRWEVVDWFNLA